MTTTSCSPTRSTASRSSRSTATRCAARPEALLLEGAKWIRGLEFLDHDQLGFWERYGYNNDADPWKEERSATSERRRRRQLRTGPARVPWVGREVAQPLAEQQHLSVEQRDEFLEPLGRRPASSSRWRRGSSTWTIPDSR